MAVNFIKNPSPENEILKRGDRRLNFYKGPSPEEEAKRLAKEEEDLKEERRAFEAEKAATETPEAKPRRKYIRKVVNA